MENNFTTYNSGRGSQIKIDTYSVIEYLGCSDYKGDSVSEYNEINLDQTGYCTLPGDQVDCTSSVECESGTLTYHLRIDAYFLGDDATKTYFFEFCSPNPIKIEHIRSASSGSDEIRIYS